MYSTKHLKRGWLCSLLLMSAFCMTSVKAEDGTAYLATIAKNTTGILANLASLPNYITIMVQYALNMQSADTSSSTQSMQGDFAQTGNAITQNTATQTVLQTKLNADLISSNTQTTLPNGNDLVYSTLLGKPLFSPDPRTKSGTKSSVDAAYNYIKNASGLTLPHAAPQPSWRGIQYDYNRYAAYYNTVMAVQSFNGYLLSAALAEMQNNNGLSTAQAALITKASSSNWIASVASEAIGVVLRQLLIFTSQNYVLMTQLLQTQKQLLIAQAMTNALLIANNQTNENTLTLQAEGQSGR